MWSKECIAFERCNESNVSNTKITANDESDVYHIQRRKVSQIHNDSSHGVLRRIFYLCHQIIITWHGTSLVASSVHTSKGQLTKTRRQDKRE